MRVYLGFGSNIDPVASIQAGLDALQAVEPNFHTSSVYQSDSVGFVGAPFLNLVVALDTGLTLEALHQSLREIEFRFGRPEQPTRNSSRRLDIDILLYADCVGHFGFVELPRPEIHYNAFVLKPLSELAPGLALPNTDITVGELWERFDQAKQPLHKVAFVYRGALLPASFSDEANH